MIKNIVFDLGNVLISFQPDTYLFRRFNNQQIISELYQKVFRSQDWAELDRGTITEKEVIEKFCRLYPHLADSIKSIFADWGEILIPIEGSVDILNHLAKQEYNLYVLSNFHLEAFKRISSLDFFKHFDGMVISAKINYIKPEPEIYQHLLKEFRLIPGETVFIDDVAENIKGAAALGIETIQFKDPVQLEKELKILGIEL